MLTGVGSHASGGRPPTLPPPLPTTVSGAFPWAVRSYGEALISWLFVRFGVVAESREHMYGQGRFRWVAHEAGEMHCWCFCRHRESSGGHFRGLRVSAAQTTWQMDRKNKMWIHDKRGTSCASIETPPHQHAAGNGQLQGIRQLFRWQQRPKSQGPLEQIHVGVDAAGLIVVSLSRSLQLNRVQRLCFWGEESKGIKVRASQGAAFSLHHRVDLKNRTCVTSMRTRVTRS